MIMLVFAVNAKYTQTRTDLCTQTNRNHLAKHVVTVNCTQSGECTGRCISQCVQMCLCVYVCSKSQQEAEILISMRGSPDAALTPSLTFPTLNLTGADLPHISSSRESEQEHWLTHMHKHTQSLSRTTTDIVHIFQDACPCLSSPPFCRLSPHSFSSACTEEASLILRQCKHL